MEFLPTWVWLSLIVSFSSAGWKLVNEYFKVDSHALVFWRGFLPFIFMLPFTFFIPWPTDYIFYVLVLMVALIGTFTDVVYLDASKKYGAGVPSRLQPLGLFIGFIGWIIIDTSQIDVYMAQPIYATGVVLSLCSIVFFASRLRHCEVSKNALIFMLPAIFFGGFFGVLIKTAMQHAELYQGIVFYILVQGIGITIFTLIKEKFKKRKLKRILQKDVMKAGFFIGVFGVISGSCGSYAFHLAENPAYSSAITMLSPFWIIILYKIISRKENGVDVLSGVFLVLSVISLVLFKGML